jgi:phosphoribosylcarboxyaminoimidazole (NCAIR) mutase
VATVALGEGGAKNAALLAISILALTRQDLADRLSEYRRRMAEELDR